MTLPGFLLRVPRALAVLAGWDDGEKLARALTIERDLATQQLAICRQGRQEEARRLGAVVAEKDRQLEELRREIEANTKPGDVLRRRLERVRRGAGGGSDP